MQVSRSLVDAGVEERDGEAQLLEGHLAGVVLKIEALQMF